MKIIFLDIDGVIATSSSYTRIEHLDSYLGDSWVYTGFPGLDPNCVQRINKLTDTTKAKIVISSTWRHGTQLDFCDLVSYLRQEGITGIIIDRTPSLCKIHSVRGYDYQRGNECLSWIDAHPEVTHFVCIDDDNDFHIVRDNLVQIIDGWDGIEQGIQDKHIEEAIRILS